MDFNKQVVRKFYKQVFYLYIYTWKWSMLWKLQVIQYNQVYFRSSNMLTQTTIKYFFGSSQFCRKDSRRWARGSKKVWSFLKKLYICTATWLPTLLSYKLMLFQSICKETLSEAALRHSSKKIFIKSYNKFKGKWPCRRIISG